MGTRLMDGTYYEIVGGLNDDVFIRIVGDFLYDDKLEKLVKESAYDTERAAFKCEYEKGKLVDIEQLCSSLSFRKGENHKSIGRIYTEPISKELSFRYQMLSRLQSDCEYFLGNGNRHEGHLWAGTVDKQIEEMKNRWNSFEDDEKPEWLTWEDILNYEKQMKGVQEYV